jgi:hypothetical protein
MPVFYPTEAQFKDPILYIESLIEGKEEIT